MFSIESLSSSGTESETERMTDFEKFDLQPYSIEQAKSKVLVGHGRNSMNDLASSSNAATNDVDGRIGNKTWCKCECCAQMETHTKSAGCLEIPEICKLTFSGRKNPARQQIENESLKTLMRHLIQTSQQMLNLIELGN